MHICSQSYLHKYTQHKKARKQHTHTHVLEYQIFFNAPSDLHKDDALPPRDEVLFSDLRYTLLLVSSLANASQRL